MTWISRSSVVLLFLASLAAGGCAGGLVHRESITSTARIAVASVVMPRLAAGGPKDAGQAALQAACDHAAEKVRSDLAGVHTWDVVALQKLPAFGSLQDKDLAAQFPSADERGRVAELLSAERADWSARFIGAKGLAVVPREALVPDQEQTQKDPAVRAVMLRQAGAFCEQLKTDAVAFVHLRYTITHPRESAFIVADDRTDGLLRLSATLVIVDRSGRIIVDMGVRPVDDRSRSRDLLPLYRGKGRDAVRPENIDLADPKKKVPQALLALVEEAVTDLMGAFAKELGR